MIIKALISGLEGANEEGYIDLPDEEAMNLVRKGLAEKVNVYKAKKKDLPKATYGNRTFEQPLDSMTEKRVKEIARELGIFIGRKSKPTLVQDIRDKLEGGK